MIDELREVYKLNSHATKQPPPRIIQSQGLVVLCREAHEEGGGCVGFGVVAGGEKVSDKRDWNPTAPKQPYLLFSSVVKEMSSVGGRSVQMPGGVRKMVASSINRKWYHNEG